MAIHTGDSSTRTVTSTAKQILSEALALPQDEREELVGALSNSLAPIESSPAWQTEVARRLRKIGSGDAVFRDAEEHLEELRAKYGG